MALNIQTRDEFVQNEIAAVQAALPGIFLFPVGSITLAMTDAHSATAMWLQSDIQVVYNRTRLSTSTGVDVDSFLAQFGVTRLPAVAATGNVTFASFTSTTQRLIPVNSTVSTVDGTLSFTVIEDTTNPNWSSTLQGYVMAISTSSISVPVQANVGGIIGNVNANTITVINSPITGVDTVTNPLAFSNGVDQQSDAQARAYFVQYLNSLSKATQGAVSFAVESVQGVENFTIVENTDYTTQAQSFGQFYVIVDDGTGNPSPSLLGAVTSSVNAVRGLAIRAAVYGPNVITATISATVYLPAVYNTTDTHDQIVSDLERYVNTIPIGGTLYYTRIAQVIYNTLNTIAPNVGDNFNVTSVLLNGATSDVTATNKEVIKITTSPTINLIDI